MSDTVHFNCNSVHSYHKIDQMQGLFNIPNVLVRHVAHLMNNFIDRASLHGWYLVYKF